MVEIMLKLVAGILFLIYAADAINGRCRALVLAGGSDKGCFQAGAISGLIEYLPPGEATWDVVTGTGIGSFNAMFVGQVGIGNETQIPTALHTFWMKFKTRHFYKSWFGGLVVGYFKKMGLYNNAAMESTIQTNFAGSFERFLAVGVTDLITANYFSANTTLPTATMLAAIRASMSDYDYFPPVEYQNFQLVSGDLVYPADIQTAINACTEMGYPFQNITVDTVTVTGAKLDAIDPSNKNTLELLIRYLKIKNYHNVLERTQNEMKDYPEVTFRTFIMTKGPFNKNSLDPYIYPPGLINQRWKEGMENAKEAVAEFYS